MNVRFWPIVLRSPEGRIRRQDWRRVRLGVGRLSGRPWSGCRYQLASFLRFCAVDAKRNSSRAPFGPLSRGRSSLRIRLRCANSISTFLRSLRDTRPSQDLAIWRAMSRAPSRIERGTFLAGVFGQHLGLRAHPAQSCLLARYRIVASSFTRVPVVVSGLPIDWPVSQIAGSASANSSVGFAPFRSVANAAQIMRAVALNGAEDVFSAIVPIYTD